MGINKQDAYNLLIKGFLLSNINDEKFLKYIYVIMNLKQKIYKLFVIFQII